jgi:hypothetical protein
MLKEKPAVSFGGFNPQGEHQHQDPRQESLKAQHPTPEALNGKDPHVMLSYIAIVVSHTRLGVI